MEVRRGQGNLAGRDGDTASERRATGRGGRREQDGTAHAERSANLRRVRVRVRTCAQKWQSARQPQHGNESVACSLLA